MFGALPCTGGSPYQRLNWKVGPKTRGMIRRHWAIFRALWRHFEIVAQTCLDNGGQIAIEWPKACAYWRLRYVKRALAKWGCQSYHFNGCMYGLASQMPSKEGQLLSKPWTIASTCASFHTLRVCDKSHNHAKTEGGDTKITEGYTDPLAHAIHHCWRIGAEVAVSAAPQQNLQYPGKVP